MTFHRILPARFHPWFGSFVLCAATLLLMRDDFAAGLRHPKPRADHPVYATFWQMADARSFSPITN